LGTCVTKSLHGVDCFLPWHAYPMSEPSYRLCVYGVERLRQAVMGWVPTLKYMLSGACGLLRPHPVMPGA
jgi:hypothetical protein